MDPLGLGLPILRNQGCTRPKMKCENYQSFRIRCISRELSYVGTCVSIELHWHAIRRNGVHAPILHISALWRVRRADSIENAHGYKGVPSMISFIAVPHNLRSLFMNTHMHEFEV